jgi:hypothetical protein
MIDSDALRGRVIAQARAAVARAAVAGPDGRTGLGRLFGLLRTGQTIPKWIEGRMER